MFCRKLDKPLTRCSTAMQVHARPRLIVLCTAAAAAWTGCAKSHELGPDLVLNDPSVHASDHATQHAAVDTASADPIDAAPPDAGTSAPEDDAVTSTEAQNDCVISPDDETQASDVTDAPDAGTWPQLEAAHFGPPALVADTFTLAEGPIWDHCTQELLFTDVEARTIHRLGADDAVGSYFEPTAYANGLAFDAQGRLLLAEMGGGQGGRISRLDRALNLEVLIDHDPSCSLLNTTDDLAVSRDGTIYFSDPVVAHGNYFGFSLTSKPVYRLQRNVEEPTLVSETQLNLPNGVRLSPDETQLYVNAYLEGRIVRYDVAEDGSLKNPSSFATGLNAPDSLCLDAAGNLYVGVSSGLLVLRADGSQVTLIPIPSSSGTTNCTFGGEDGTTLYITAWTSLYRIEHAPIPGSDWLRNRDMPCD